MFFKLLLEENFAAQQSDAQDLKTCWATYQNKVLTKALQLAASNSEPQKLLQVNMNYLDDGKLQF